MKIGFILGTRPEIIKLSSIIRYLQDNKDIEYFVIHTNQHYDYNMDKVFFDELGLSAPKYNLGIGAGKAGQMIGEMIIHIEEKLFEEKPSIVFIQGDTNTVLAGGLAANKLGIKIGHIEAGLRSYDKNMPEEINRIIVDHISDYLFCPTEKQKQILISEGIDKKHIFITGNTIVDAIYGALKMVKNCSVLSKYFLKKDTYILFTIHRPSNVDTKRILSSLLIGIGRIAKISGKKIFFPIHPRTKKNIQKFGLEYLIDESFILSEPLGFIEFLTFEYNAFMIASDSGGVQEESCVLGKRMLILRNNSERMETVDSGFAEIAGNTQHNMIGSYKRLIRKTKESQKIHPFGDGTTYKKIINIVTNISM